MLMIFVKCGVLGREQTWALCWSPENGVVRTLGMVGAAPEKDSYVYWGAITRRYDFAREYWLVPVASLGCGEHAALECLMNGIGVMRLNGW